MAAFFLFEGPQAPLVSTPVNRNVLPLVRRHACLLLPPVSPGAAPSLDVHEAPLAPSRLILWLSPSPGSWCN
ncbi:hypothetical protein P153DRAFT_364594 [Dothidotthia symphoricarpi CBS 119687]|uniref:Uncharacterized protein n=1 Tax=Dothidotthia symphoricarpi CBS 119687 TaxID=1392245 RepID=A0A6A6AK26_9PLEO|nr:uncharacterized protein P153DRAFT_364594 [Dothidotthia symphoricarpi CBS 119687]KAF2132170.1 hypothetical protein P153DRAFT_364594 [Dothidotthia symphoricarpi CBS 119687]